MEARLARSDLLVVAGLNDGVFPAAAATPVVLPGRVRRALGLPTWREARARDAELFQRLLHGAPTVALTWSRWRDQQPALPSPLIEGLQLALGGRAPEVADATPWRREESPHRVIAAGQAAFVAEPLPIARYAAARPLIALSWSVLSRWRDCPYRVLLERGFALRAEEEVREEFGRKEYGSVVHAVLREALAPDAACHAALAAGRLRRCRGRPGRHGPRPLPARRRRAARAAPLAGCLHRPGARHRGRRTGALRRLATRRPGGGVHPAPGGPARLDRGHGPRRRRRAARRTCRPTRPTSS